MTFMTHFLRMVTSRPTDAIFWGRSSGNVAGRLTKDLATETIITNATGYSMSVVANSTYVWAISSSSPYVRRFPRSDLTASATTPTFGAGITTSPVAAVINPAGTWVAVCDGSAGTFWAFNAAMDTLLTVTDPTSAVNSLAWSPDGTKIYIAMGSSPYLAVMDFNGSAFSNYTAASGGNIPSGQVNDVDVSVSGKVVVGIAVSPRFHTYDADLTNKASPAGGLIPSSSVSSVKWDKSGNFIAISMPSAVSNGLYTYSADLSARTAASSQAYTSAGGQSPKSMAFSSDNSQFFMSGTNAASATRFLYRYSYNSSTGALTGSTTPSSTPDPGGSVYSLGIF